MINIEYIQTPTIIISGSTGVNYSNQVNGCSCSYREIEGYIFPYKLSNEVINNLFFNPRWWYKQYGYCSKNYNLQEMLKLSKEDLDTYLRRGSANGSKLKDDLKQWHYWDEFVEFLEDTFINLNLKVRQDTEQLEAWINITSDYGNGILTWENCD